MRLLLIFETDGALADAFVLELRLDLENAEVAEVRRDMVDRLVVRVGESGQSVLALE